MWPAGVRVYCPRIRGDGVCDERAIPREISNRDPGVEHHHIASIPADIGVRRSATYRAIG
jgi:hypothetical protein